MVPILKMKISSVKNVFKISKRSLSTMKYIIFSFRRKAKLIIVIITLNYYIIKIINVNDVYCKYIFVPSIINLGFIYSNYIMWNTLKATILLNFIRTGLEFYNWNGDLPSNTNNLLDSNIILNIHILY